MSDVPTPDALEAMLRQRGWARRVARALCHTPLDPLDVEQEMWLAALRGDAPAPRSERAWMRTVMQRKAANLQRTADRRESRERRAARAEAQPGAVVEVVARAEARRAVMNAVMALAEPYRTTVLLRYFEDLLPGEIARRQEIPVETVKTRLRRAVAALRARLDREHAACHGAWLAALTDLAARDGASEPPARSHAVASAPARATTLGALLMTTKQTLAVAAAVLLVLTVAIVHAMSGEDAPVVPDGTTANAAPAATAPPPRMRERVEPVAPRTEAPSPAPAQGDAVPDEDTPEDVAVAAPPRLAIHVRDAAGDPVRDALVYLLRPGDAGHHALPPEVPRSKTNARGDCAFEELEGAHVIAVQKRGHPMEFADVDLAREPHPEVEITLAGDGRGVRIAGTVRNASDGSPLAGARIGCRSLAGDGGETLAFPGRGVAQRIKQEALSGADGSYVLEGLSPGRYMVFAFAPGHVDAGPPPEVDAPQDALDLELVALPRVEVRVTDWTGGEDVPVRISLTPVGKRGSPIRYTPDAEERRTGTFVVDQVMLTPGVYDLRVEADGLGAAEERIEIAEFGVLVRTEVALAAAPVLTVRIGGGGNVDGHLLVFAPGARHPEARRMTRPTIDLALKPGKYALEFFDAARISARRTVELSGAGAAVTLAPEAATIVRAVGAAGRSLTVRERDGSQSLLLRRVGSGGFLIVNERTHLDAGHQIVLPRRDGLELHARNDGFRPLSLRSGEVNEIDFAGK